ncbi:MAG TPA: FAD-dependent oxidoreductase, partial [Pseudonocardia sp.]|nr:FAD-dependent oxidoreductase [Pseudonocardia sp.]
TERTPDGQIMDLAATATSHKYAAMLALARDAGIADKIVPSSDMVGIPLRGQMQRIRSSKMIDLATTKLLPLSAKLKAAPLMLDARKVARASKWYDLGAAGEADVETAAEWVARRGHPEIDKAVFNALMRGAYLASSTTMSVLDLHFLINGFFGSELFTFAGGLGTLPEALASFVDVRLRARVTSVEEDGAGVRVSVFERDAPERTERADVAVIAVPAPLMTQLYPQLNPEYREIAAAADYVPLMTVKLLLDRRPDEKAMFIALPERESPELGALFLEHVKYSDRSPEGKGQVGGFWDGRWNNAQWDAPDEAIVDKTIGAASEWLPGLENMVESSRVYRWRHGVLNSRPGSYRDLHKIAAAQDHANRVFLAGDYFGGPSVNAALCSGEKAAERIVARHGSTRS